MKQYVIAGVYFFDNVIEQKLVEASCEVEAYKLAFHMLHGVMPPLEGEISKEDIMSLAFNCDSLVSVLPM